MSNMAPSVEDWNVSSAAHAVVPLSSCPHLHQVTALPSGGVDARAKCTQCGTGAEVWLCLSCWQAHCGRFVCGHALSHAESDASHSMALSLADLSVWCYACDAYVHNEVLVPAKAAAHLSKFGERMPSAEAAQQGSSSH